MFARKFFAARYFAPRYFPSELVFHEGEFGSVVKFRNVEDTVKFIYG